MNKKLLKWIWVLPFGVRRKWWFVSENGELIYVHFIGCLSGKLGGFGGGGHPCNDLSHFDSSVSFLFLSTCPKHSRGRVELSEGPECAIGRQTLAQWCGTRPCLCLVVSPVTVALPTSCSSLTFVSLSSINGLSFKSHVKSDPSHQDRWVCDGNQHKENTKICLHN